MRGKTRRADKKHENGNRRDEKSSGDAIHKAVMLDEFDPEKGGISLYRDGFHLVGTYGRYLAALVWFNFFTGRSADDVTYAPDGTDPALIKKLKALV